MNAGKILSLQEITAQQADRCTRAQNTLLNSASTCGDAFFTFQNAYFDYDDSTPIQQSLNQICQRDSCKSAVSEYLDACQDIGNVSVHIDIPYIAYYSWWETFTVVVTSFTSFNSIHV